MEWDTILKKALTLPYQHRLICMLSVMQENANSSSSQSRTTVNDMFKTWYRPGRLNWFMMEQVRNQKNAPPPQIKRGGGRGGTLITTSEWMKEPTINRMRIIQRGFCFQLGIESYLADILETVSWWHLGVVTITATSIWGPTSQLTDRVLVKSVPIMSEGRAPACTIVCLCTVLSLASVCASVCVCLEIASVGSLHSSGCSNML